MKEIEFTRRPRKLEEQPENPLHGIKLTEILEYLVDKHGYPELGEALNLNCFKSNPTFKSSLKFLRTMPWAREKVEKFYLRSIKKK